MTVVVPKITSMLIDTGQTLPGPTQVLVAISNRLQELLVGWCLLSIAAISFVVERVYKTDEGPAVHRPRTCCAFR
jgi:type II secretory pathway component PulF